MIVGPDGELRAVLDWELATLGDTLADVGWLLSSWLEPGEQHVEPVRPADDGAPGSRPVPSWPSATPATSGRDLSDLPVLRRVQPVALGVHRRGRAGPVPRRP